MDLLVCRKIHKFVRTYPDLSERHFLESTFDGGVQLLQARVFFVQLVIAMVRHDDVDKFRVSALREIPDPPRHSLFGLHEGGCCFPSRTVVAVVAVVAVVTVTRCG